MFTEKKLKELLKEFLKLDFNSKNGNIDLEIGLKALLCNYCNKSKLMI